MAERMPERSDDDLVRGYLGGDMEAFEALYGRYRSRLLGFIRSMGPSRAEAEDLFQETWLRAIRGMGRYRSEGRFRAWLFTIARNAFVDRVRKTGREMPMGEDEEEPAGEATNPIPRPDETLSERERMDRLHRAIGALPPGERQVLELRVREEMSFLEIGEVLDIPVGTALWRMHRAVRRLAETLAGDESAEGAADDEVREKKRG